MSNAIEFENISKQYRLGVVSTGTLSHDLNRWWHTKMLRREDPYLKIGETNDRAHKGESQYVWALKDINFKVEQGDVVGIIGKNGAGKSTLLKLLSRVTAPTTGVIRAKGRIASLLEVGTGFHPEMTGRENIYMNGSIMGMSKFEINRKLDEIVDFSGCERYLDTPVKRYSSGMIVRLGFAIAAHLEPEILVIDEVLAVGDAEFQKKAIGKMQDVSKGQGRTVLFVSHNMAAVKSLCNTGVLLENGRVGSIGVIEDVIEEYLSNSIKDSSISFKVSHKENYKFNSFRILNSNGIETNSFMTGESLFFDIGIQNCLFDNSIGIGVYFYNLNGEKLAGTTSFFGSVNRINKSNESNNCLVKLKIPQINLTAGTYFIELVLAQKNVKRLDHYEKIAQISIIDGLTNIGSHLGYFYINAEWIIQ